MTRLRGLAPICDDRARILILGSFPSPASLAAGQYYANPRNAFWPIMSRLFGFDATAPYDTFAGLLPRHRYDVVVSNPPYIPRSEYASMRDNVRLYEPAGALFVEDADPLLFYREIGHKAARLLDAGGRLFFEVHEDYACGVCTLLSGQGFVGVECRCDMNGKPRMVRCVKE